MRLIHFVDIDGLPKIKIVTPNGQYFVATSEQEAMRIAFREAVAIKSAPTKERR